jgi:hypothetical protein
MTSGPTDTDTSPMIIMVGRNEHTRLHFVAGWDQPAALEPA